MPIRFTQVLTIACAVAALSACHNPQISTSPPVPPAAEATPASHALPDAGARDQQPAPAQQNPTTPAETSQTGSGLPDAPMWYGPESGTGVTSTQSVDASDTCGGYE